MLRFLTVTIASLLLTACGFSLRGTASLPKSIEPLYLENADDGAAIHREVLRALVDNNIAVANAASTTGYSLLVGTEISSERALSVNANARAGEYEVIMTVPFQLRRGNTAAQPQQSVTIGKVYLADPDNAIAKTEEATLIRNEMRTELAHLILRRLQAFKP